MRWRAFGFKVNAMLKLKPCPFCGCAALMEKRRKSYFIYCKGGYGYCDVSTRTKGYVFKWAAVLAWNRRV